MINFLPFHEAVRLATLAGQIYQRKQRVYKDPVWGWTWTNAPTPNDQMLAAADWTRRYAYGD